MARRRWVTATTGEDGTISFAAAPDPDFDGELDDAVLDAVVGGGGCVQGADTK